MSAIARSASRLSLVAMACSLAACSSLSGGIADDRIDYRSAAQTQRPASLEVPPDLSQLQKDNRYQAIGGVVSAARSEGVSTSSQSVTATPGALAAAPAGSVAPASTGDARILRDGQVRWIASKRSADALWPEIKAFLTERGLGLAREDLPAGILETEWAENRARLPQDIVRSTIGKVFDNLWSSGERDKFVLRIERATDGGSEIYLSHRGVREVYTSERKDSTTWQASPANTQLENELMQRLVLRLNGQAQASAEQANKVEVPAPTRSRVRALEGQAALEISDNFDRAWRRVGLSLDRSGFTVEDRDRSAGVYEVRYADKDVTAQGEPGFFAKLFSSKDRNIGLAKYKILVKSNGQTSTATVLDAQGKPETTAAGQRIIQILLSDLQ